MILDGLINGLVIGGAMSLNVLGIVVIYGITGVVNFAIGTLGVFAAFLTWQLSSFNLWVALPSGIGAGALLGYILQRLFITPISERWGGGLVFFFIVTNLIGMVFAGLTRVIFPRPNISINLPQLGSIPLGGTTVSGLKILALMFALTTLVALKLMEEHSDIGKSWKATSQNLKLAKLMGVNTQRAFNMASAIGIGLAAAGAILWGAVYNLNVGSGFDLTFTGYIIAVVGGIGNIWGGILAAFLMGLVRSFSAHFVGGNWQSVILYTIAILVLIIAPKGILGSERSV